MIQTSFSTNLNDRVLWYDGDVSVSPNSVVALLSKGIDQAKVYVTETNAEIDRFNAISQHQLRQKTDVKPLDYQWTIDPNYQKIDVEDFILSALEQEIDGLNKTDRGKRIKRTLHELSLFKEKSLFNVLRLMVYMIDVLEAKNAVWGVGRGSSVSSYVLYLIGVHDVDSVEHDLPIEDFLHG